MTKKKEKKTNNYEKIREKLISTSNYLIIIELELVKHKNLRMLKN